MVTLYYFEFYQLYKTIYMTNKKNATIYIVLKYIYILPLCTVAIFHQMGNAQALL